MPDLTMAPPPEGLLRERYGDHAPAAPLRLNETIRTLLGHRSVRRYLDEPLAPGTLETLVAAAQSASTSSNLQVWTVVAVEEPDRKARLAALVGDQKHVVQAPLFLVWLADLARAERLSAQAGGGREGIDYVESFLVAVVDATLAAQSAVAALESLGLGSVYIGGIRNHPQAVAAELGLPPRVMPLFGLCVGKPDPERPTSVKPRLPQEAVLHRETYDPAQADEAVARYDVTLSGFQRAQGMAEVAWSKIVADRLGVLKGLNGRERLRAALESLGFELR